jgi:CBS-domain-containing membrane protein
VTGTSHPPAGIDPLALVVNDMSWGFLVAPVGIRAMLLALFAFAWHKLASCGANRNNIRPARRW